ncbi:MAG: Loki-CTERM sorting domain-containing protein [Candidatus Hodarchaeota archaeon]
MATHKIVTPTSIIFLLLIVIPLIPLNSANLLQMTQPTQIIQSSTNNRVSSVGSPLIAPGPDLGITNWTHNHFDNPGLELWYSPYYPIDWSYYLTCDRFQWLAISPPYPVSEGTYSAAQQTRSGNGVIGWSHWYQSNVFADMQNLTLTFDWYVGPMPDPNNDFFTMYVRLTDGRFLYYYLAGGNTLSLTNYSNTGIYQILGPLSVWNAFHRNITADYLALPLFPGTISPGLEVRDVYFHLQTGSSTFQWVQSFFDDVQLQNETITFIGGSTRNGNLEMGTFDFWSSAGNRDQAFASQSITAHTGTYSCNLTAASTGNASYVQLFDIPQIRISNDNPGFFSCWWQLNQYDIGYYDYVTMNFQFHNFTHYYRIYYIVGYGGPLIFSNGTFDRYYHIDGFNTTGTWQYFQRNLWQEVSSAFGGSDTFVDTIYITAFSINPNSRIELLVDDFILRSRTVTVGDFEDQRAPGSLIYGWGTQTSYDLTVSDQGYGGGKAANCSLDPFGGVLVTQNLHKRPFNSTRETYLDLMWRIEDFTDGQILFSIEFEDNRVLYYILGISNWGGLLNDSQYCYFNATGSGTIGSWIQLHRDLVHDYEAAFGSLPATQMHEITFYAYTNNANLEILYDDVYIYDDPAPRLHSHQLVPSVPLHNGAVQVDIDAEDQDLDTVQLTYRINAGTWNVLTMAHQTGNTYRSTIPGQPYATSVEYYFQANDTWGMITVLQDGANPFQYTVDEQDDPLIAIDAPNDGATISGTVNINVTASDAISGMDYVEFAIDSTPIHTSASSPYTYAWDSTTVADGSYSITATAYDNAGNSAVDSITITVSNGITPPPIPGFPIEALIIGLVGALGVILVLRRRRQR